MKTQNIQKQKGFTLVEIAIVLVIIGLLLGGVLKGQELITNAKIKSVTSDFDSISAGYYAYQDRTGHLAGDLSGSAYDGLIADGQFWSDLRSEGFINGLSSDVSGPVHSLDGAWTAGNGAPFAAGQNWICASGIVDTYATGMDQKKDDGAGLTGAMRGAASSGGAAAAYTTTGTAEQVVCHEL